MFVFLYITAQPTYVNALIVESLVKKSSQVDEVRVSADHNRKTVSFSADIAAFSLFQFLKIKTKGENGDNEGVENLFIFYSCVAFVCRRVFVCISTTIYLISLFKLILKIEHTNLLCTQKSSFSFIANMYTNMKSKHIFIKYKHINTRESNVENCNVI